MPEDGPELGKKIAGCAFNTKQMWYLADNGDAYKALDEAPHHRRRDEGSHPAHPHQAEQREQDTDQNGKGGGEGIKGHGALGSDGSYRQSRDQSCRGIWTDYQQTR